jgi:hypothetical protein
MPEKFVCKLHCHCTFKILKERNSTSLNKNLKKILKDLKHPHHPLEFTQCEKSGHACVSMHGAK